MKKYGKVKPETIAAARASGLSVRRVNAGPGFERPPYYLLFTLDSERLCAKDELANGEEYVAIYRELIKMPSNITDWKYIGLGSEQDASVGRIPQGLLKQLVEVHLLGGAVITDPVELERWIERKIALKK
jgi:hypothetical protein